MTPYNESMLMLAKAGAIFMGQSVSFDGTAMFHDLEGVPMEQRIELPVAEELQLGMATGMAMMGLLPVCIYPRMDFLLRAMDQLVNHLDKMAAMTEWNPKVIIRTRVGATKPLNAGPQHTQDHSRAFRLILTNVDVFEIKGEADIMETYNYVLRNARSSLVVENIR